MKKINKQARRLFALVTIVGGLIAFNALPASAHVTITPDSAAQGSYGTFAFKVPNESDSSSTTQIEVQLPSEYPISSVSVQPKQGWSYNLERSKVKETNGDKKVEESTTKITWSGGSIKPGEFDMFYISMGPLPKNTDSLTFKALQTYDDGNVVSWIQESKNDKEHPEHPAPVLKLTQATDNDHSSHDTSAKDKTIEDDSDSDSDSDSQNNTVGYVGIALGLVAIIMAAGALTKKK